MSTAVLFSAGLDSVVLAALESRRGPVQPVYVSSGLAWETEERAAVARLLAAPVFAPLLPLVELAFPVADLYPSTHWALRGEPPEYETPDADVYLHGRNIALLTTCAIHCARQGMPRIAIGPLAGNPFPDATREFFDAMAQALSLGLAHPIAIDAPFLDLHKQDVIRLGVELGVPLGLTLSCMNPRDGVHCGGCSKCRERRDAFRTAGVPDPGVYRHQPVGS